MTAVRIGVRDYVRHQAESGLFHEDVIAPENDPRVLHAYLDLLEQEYPQESDFAVTLALGRYGFYRDPVDDARDGLNWALSTPIIDMCIGVDGETFARDLPRLKEEIDEAVLTDTFSVTDGFGSSVVGVPLMNSPVADIDTPFAGYVAGLTSERRKKYRRMVSDFENSGLSFLMDDGGLAAAEIDFVRSNLERKWGEDAGYAYRQTLWFLAVASVRPSQCRVMRVTDGDGLVFLQTMIDKAGHLTCQSIVKNEDKFFSGIAAFTDFKCIEQLCDDAGCRVFDPSCRTSLDDPESIGVAKRATVNANCRKPLLAFNIDPASAAGNVLADATVLGREA